MPEEVTVFQNGELLITTARAVLGQKTYAMASITSVSAYVIPANQTVAVGLLILGLALVGMAGFAGIFGIATLNTGGGYSIIVISAVIGILGLGSIVGGIAAFKSTKPSYAVRIGSASGEANVLISKDRTHIQKIVNAINEAIAKRG